MPDSLSDPAPGPAAAPAVAHRNWAGNVAFGATGRHAPASLDELQRLVRDVPRLRVHGARHSFNAIADTTGAHLSLHRLDRVLALDAAARTVTVEAGIGYGRLAPQLDAAGFALANLASLPQVTIAGAVATATHGSGNANGNLATAIAALTLVGVDGELVTLRRGDADFPGAVVSLGALGVVATLTLDLVPRYDIRQSVWLDLPVAALIDNFEAISAAAYSVSLFTPWHGDRIAQVWLKQRADAELPTEFFGARPATQPMHPLPGFDPAPCTAQLGVAGPWHERLPHFRMGAIAATGAELQSEYYVARADAAAAIVVLRAMQQHIAPALLAGEIRTMAADELWLSPNYRRDSVGFHFTWKPDVAAVGAVLPRLEAALAPFAPRPHWAKLFAMTPAALRAAHPRFADFRELAGRRDPAGKFRNRFLDDIFGA